MCKNCGDMKHNKTKEIVDKHNKKNRMSAIKKVMDNMKKK